MEFIIGVGAAVLLGAIIFALRKPRAPNKTTLELIDEANALAPRLVEQYVERAKALPIVDRSSSLLLHRPIYDCGTDLFEPPCTGRGFDGFPAGPCWLSAADLPAFFKHDAKRVAQTQAGVVLQAGVAIVRGGDFLDVVEATHAQKPGGLVARLVRVAPDRWHVHRWKAGMVPSAHDADPPFFVAKIAQAPELWLRREQTVRDLWQRNDAWRSAAARCSHGVR